MITLKAIDWNSLFSDLLCNTKIVKFAVLGGALTGVAIYCAVAVRKQ